MWIVGDVANVLGYGHLGDGNLHLKVSVPQYDDKVAQTNTDNLVNWLGNYSIHFV